MNLDVRKWARRFPLVLEIEDCEECGGPMTETRARAPAIQEHWRGVPAWECRDCGHTTLKEGPDLDGARV